MRLSLCQARKRPWLAPFVFPALSVLLFAGCSNLATVQSNQFAKKREKIVRAIIKINNRCSHSHYFRITSDIEDPGFNQQTDAILVDATSTKKIEVLFDAMRSKNNFKAVAECLDCKKEDGCRQVRAKVSIEMTPVKILPLKKGEVPAVSTKFSSGLFANGANDVGIIPQNSAGCPAGSAHIYISIDDEENHKFGSQNISSVQGWTGDISRYSTGTTFGFCRVDGKQFGAHASNDYAVLQFGSSCPAGSISVGRYFDNENSNTHNWSNDIDIGPNCISVMPGGTICTNKKNTKGLDTIMKFCFFNAGNLSGMQPFPDLQVPYGVFAAPSSTWFATGTVLTDDEDSTNNDSTLGITNLSNIVFGTDFPLEGPNTKLLVAKVANDSCTNPCPYIGSYDTANCWVGQPPSGTTALAFHFGLDFFLWTPANGCPIWYDAAPCSARQIPPQTRSFIWSNMWYVEPACRP